MVADRENDRIQVFALDGTFLEEWTDLRRPSAIAIDRAGFVYTSEMASPVGQTTDPEELYRGGTLTPLGGRGAGHKGYGYSLAAALLGALAIIGDPDPTPAGALEGFSGVGGVFLAVVNPALFGDAEDYARLVARTLDEVKRVRPRPGVAEVLYPGEPEFRARELRARDGIPIPDALWHEFTQIGQRFRVELPESSRP